ncbi:MAG: hypothetical protein JXI32_03340 [Deltaproteobacteria bacterium]|nr:hypothetical protein [Deltaproteobacteria bacterium]
MDTGTRGAYRERGDPVSPGMAALAGKPAGHHSMAETRKMERGRRGAGQSADAPLRGRGF